MIDEPQAKQWREHMEKLQSEQMQLLTSIRESLQGKPPFPGLIDGYKEHQKVLYGNGQPGLIQEVRRLTNIKSWFTHTATGLIMSAATAGLLKMLGLLHT